VEFLILILIITIHLCNGFFTCPDWDMSGINLALSLLWLSKVLIAVIEPGNSLIAWELYCKILFKIAEMMPSKSIAFELFGSVSVRI